MTTFDDGTGAGPTLYAGGAFNSAGGVTTRRIARWDGEAWTALKSGANANVEVLAVFDDGSGAGPALYAGGGFTIAGDVETNRIAKWDGASWSALGTGMNAPVHSLAAFDDGSGAGPALYAGGSFGFAGGGVTSEPVEVELPFDGTEITLTIPRPASVAGTVVDAQGQPVGGAFIDGKRDGDEFSSHFALDQGSDDEGHFTVEGLTPGEVRLFAVKEGHARSDELVLQIESAQRVEGVTLTLGIGGTIVGEVAGVERIAGRVIHAWADGEVREARTDESGRFRLEALTPGTWQLGAGATDAELAGVEEGDWFARQSLQKEARVTVRAGETVNVVLGALPEEAIRVYGRAVLGDEPIAGVRVQAFPQASEWSFSSRASAVTDGDGNYEMHVDGPGDYAFLVASESLGYQTTRREAVPSGGAFHLDFAISLGTVTGHVLGPDGTLLSGIVVTGMSEAPALGPYATATTDQSGAYTLNVAAGTWTVSAGGSSQLLSWSADDQPAYAPDSRAGIEVTGGQSVKGVDLHLAQGGTLKGRAVDAGGAPAEVAVIYVRGADGALASAIPAAQAMHNGEYTANGLTPGTAHAIALTTDGLVGTGSSVVTAGAVTELDLELIPGTLLAVHVLDASGPVSDARVEVWTSGGFQIPNALFQSPGKGGASFGPVPAGAYSVTATRGADTARTTVAVSGGSDQTVQLTLDK